MAHAGQKIGLRPVGMFGAALCLPHFRLGTLRLAQLVVQLGRSFLDPLFQLFVG